MSKINSFNKQNLKSIRSEINSKLAELASLGLKIELGNITFDHDSFNGKITCRLESAEDQYAKEFHKSMEFAIHGDKVGKTFNQNGKNCIFRGFKPRARTNIAVYECQGKLYRTDYEMIKNRF